MKITSIASGSGGNAYLVENDGSALLVDCGVPLKALKGFEFDAVLLTHSHTDHTLGLPVVLKHRAVPVFANAMTAAAVMSQHKLAPDSFATFENGQTFEIGAFSVSPFSIPHDTEDPVGYLVRAGTMTYFHGTDIGTPLDSIGVKLAEADVATLESNHDTVMLRTSGRPPSLIQRIAGPRGHLSNDQACELVTRFAAPHLRALALAHLSRDCNAPHLAEAAMRRSLAEMHRPDIRLTVLPQDETCLIFGE